MLCDHADRPENINTPVANYVSSRVIDRSQVTLEVTQQGI